ncbi:hypothetical protein HNP52_000809 [Sphingomonas kyeonggiensis]|uniref:Uncharacterized protein n=1 Tax=Sphingomonas kyeonggiensis TaxID=1268553 RepID=A0A7W7JYN4_9SPHN|nr:hypothetical protein [Sphingomonas kyeonggiensis]MBB4837758.1 hypothetical protein [Sphingomonas kyeonggiensis]
MATTLRKGMIAFAGIAVIGGGLAGVGLASFAQSGAFEFYKQTLPPTQGAVAAAPVRDGYYSAASPVPAYPENPYPPRPLNPPRPLTIARPAEPIDYQHAARIDPEPVVAEEQAALPEPGPVIAPRRGSWTAPMENEPLPETDRVADEGAS